MLKKGGDLMEPRLRDLELSNKVIEGDSKSFEILLGDIRNKIKYRAMKAVGCQDAAEDIAQQAMVNAYLKLNKFRGDSTFSSWMYAITTNCIRMHLRGRKRIESREKRIAGDMQYEMVDNTTPQQNAELLEVCDIIREAIGAIPERYQGVITLWISGMTVLQITEYLGIGRSATKSLIHRARRYLKEYILEKYGKPAGKEIF